jgi:hypothetical protein
VKARHLAQKYPKETVTIALSGVAWELLRFGANVSFSVVLRKTTNSSGVLK